MRPWPAAGRWHSPMTWLARSPPWPTYSTAWTAPQPPQPPAGEPRSWAPRNGRRRLARPEHDHAAGAWRRTRSCPGSGPSTGRWSARNLRFTDARPARHHATPVSIHVPPTASPGAARLRLVNTYSRPARWHRGQDPTPVVNNRWRTPRAPPVGRAYSPQLHEGADDELGLAWPVRPPRSTRGVRRTHRSRPDGCRSVQHPSDDTGRMKGLCTPCRRVPRVCRGQLALAEVRQVWQFGSHPRYQLRGGRGPGRDGGEGWGG